MSDLREQLLKAGLVSKKQIRQAKHQDRVHRKEVGHEGIDAERAERERRERAAAEEKKQSDRERERERRESAAAEERESVLRRRIQAGWIREATGGSRRFFFIAGGDRITYLDLADQAVRRLQSGTAAIVETRGAARGEFCVIDSATAGSLARDHQEVIRFWNRSSAR